MAHKVFVSYHHENAHRKDDYLITMEKIRLFVIPDQEGSGMDDE
jgi:hypothetical protein